jgi:hypothetical protein
MSTEASEVHSPVVLVIRKLTKFAASGYPLSRLKLTSPNPSRVPKELTPPKLAENPLPKTSAAAAAPSAKAPLTLRSAAVLSLFENLCPLRLVKEVNTMSALLLVTRLMGTVAYGPVNPVRAAPGASICSVIVARADGPVRVTTATTVAAKATEASVRFIEYVKVYKILSQVFGAAKATVEL